MFKYISSTRLNLAVLAQIIGIVLAVRATPFSLLAGVALFVLGAIFYRRELSNVLAARSSRS
jgi:hypothetical protein